MTPPMTRRSLVLLALAALRRRGSAVALALALAGCVGDDGVADPHAGFCESISGGRTQVTGGASEPCAGCAIFDAGHAIDGNFATYALLTVTRGGTVTLRATAQPGVVFAAGSNAGVAADHLVDFNEMTINTYLDGVLQDSTVAASSLYEPSPVFYGLTATRPFDAVEVQFRFAAPGTTNVTRDHSSEGIYEFCSDRSAS